MSGERGQLLDETGHLWSCGRAHYLRSLGTPTGTLPVAVLCRFGHLDDQWALLDTAASWSIVGGTTAEELGEHLGATVGTRRISTRHGLLTGELRPVSVSFVANEAGTDLTIAATCLVIPDWYGPEVLGYSGCLERLRFALDPGAEPDTETFYFGPVP